jgi:type I pantothenate kinase
LIAFVSPDGLFLAGENWARMNHRVSAAPPHAVSSPYRHFTREEWAELRADTELTLTVDDLRKLQSTHDPISLDEVEAIYLPLSRLLALYVAATQGLFKATQRFLGASDGKVPYIIGVAGSVAVGKSTTARVLKALLTRWPNTPKVELITTDGFLHPNARLIREGLMDRKGFPESYDGPALIRFLADVKAGTRDVKAPVYSHLVYDVVPGETIVVDRPDILIVEGLNVLSPNRLSREGREIPVVSDFFDFSVFLDASDELLEKWYIERFMRLRETSFRDPRSYFRKYADLDDEEAEATARSIWRRINLVNLHENILPTRPRASLRLTKGASHRIEEVALRKL